MREQSPGACHGGLGPQGVLDSLRRMTAFVRQAEGGRAGLMVDFRSLEKENSGAERNLGWWVLALGEPYAGAGFERRDELRDCLRGQVEAAGLALPDYVWVHDDTDCAQLVVATLPTRERAQRLAERLRKRGLAIRVVREMD